MIYITFKREGHKFRNITTRALVYWTAIQQRQLRAKWLLCSTGFFAFVSSLKLSRRLLCSVRFVFVSTFNLQRGRAFVVGITNFSKEALCVKAKAPRIYIFVCIENRFNRLTLRFVDCHRPREALQFMFLRWMPVESPLPLLNVFTFC